LYNAASKDVVAKRASREAKRAAVKPLISAERLGFTSACGLIGVSWSLYLNEPKRPGNGPVKEPWTELAGQTRRYSYRRWHVLVLRETWPLNWKRRLTELSRGWIDRAIP